MLKMTRSVDKGMCCRRRRRHVTEEAYKLGLLFTILSIVGCLIAGISFISTGLNAKIIYKVVTTLVSLLCWLPILCGHICGKRSHQMYLPFLYLFAISTVYAFLAVLYFVLQRILMFKSPDSIYVMVGLSLEEYEQLVSSSTGAFAFYILSMVVILAFWCWVYSIVFRAYKFTKQVGGDGTFNETEMPI